MDAARATQARWAGPPSPSGQARPRTARPPGCERAAARVVAGAAARPDPTTPPPASATTTARTGPPPRTRRAARQATGLTAAAVPPSSSTDAAAAAAAPPPPLPTIPFRLNTTPTPRPTRDFFYQEAADGLDAALADGRSKRLAVRLTIPETDKAVDAYRLATVLELVRASVMRLTARGVRCRVCVQGPLGEGFFQGLPLALSGCARMMRAMDWAKDGDDGSANPAAALVSFGDVSLSAVTDGGPADVFFVIGPQNMSGACVTAPLAAMVDAAEAGGAAVVLVNPSLADVPSSGGLMSVRGRGDRLAFEASFVDAYYFRLLFQNPSIPYPILGALRHTYGGDWQVWAREDDAGAEGRERYVLAGTTPERPTPGEMTAMLRARREAVERAEWEAARAAAAAGSGGGGSGEWWKFW